MAAAWSKVLLGGKKNKAKAKKETWSGIEEVVFAIKDPGLADGFETAFGPGLTRREVEDDDGPGMEGSIEDDAEELRMRELQDKISELELRMQQTANDQVKSGLGGILAGLRSQLGADQDAPTKGGNHGSRQPSDDEVASDQDTDESSSELSDDEAEDGDRNRR